MIIQSKIYLLVIWQNKYFNVNDHVPLRIYELYTFALGIYVCLLAIRFCTMVTGWIQQGLEQLSRRAMEWAYLVRHLHMG